MCLFRVQLKPRLLVLEVCTLTKMLKTAAQPPAMMKHDDSYVYSGLYSFHCAAKDKCKFVKSSYYISAKMTNLVAISVLH